MLFILSLLMGSCGADEGTAQTKDSIPWLINQDKERTPATDITSPKETTSPKEETSSVLSPHALVEESAKTGASCTHDADCEGGTCQRDDMWSQGYCTQLNCSLGSCSSQGGGDCVIFLSDVMCAASCGDTQGVSTCREGYSCTQVNSSQVCLPTPPKPSADGEACTSDSNCLGGTCIPSQAGWPMGYCTSVGCSSAMDCSSPNGEDNKCLLNPRSANLCVRICSTDDECRSGYVCQPLSRTQGFCAPDPSPPLEEDFDAYPFPITCFDPATERVSLAYNVPSMSSAYMFTPFARDRKDVRPISIGRPSNRNINFPNAARRFQLIQSQINGWNNPTVVPALNTFTTDLEFGDHQFNLETNSKDLCHYTLSESTSGTTIDMNIYFVGVPNLNASNAAQNPNIISMLQKFDDIYTAANVQIGQRRFYDIVGADASNFSVIRTSNDAEMLVQRSKRPGDTYDDVVSINVFFTRGFALGGAIGISTGLPGPAALHGTPNSGVVFTSEFLGNMFQGPSGQVVDGNTYTGIIMAHEIGHYLGLFHTTEQGSRSFDPIADTPTCSRNQFPSRCSDRFNLMFPFATLDNLDLTPGQTWVIQVNPLTKD